MYLLILGALLNKELLFISIIKIRDFWIIPSDLIAFLGRNGNIEERLIRLVNNCELYGKPFTINYPVNRYLRRTELTLKRADAAYTTINIESDV